MKAGMRELRRIQCSEIWGGIRDADLDVETDALRASLYSSASDGDRGGDIYYLSACANDIITRIAVADVSGHGEAVSEISQWFYKALVDRMDSFDGSGILEDLNGLVNERGLKMTTAAVLSFHVTDSCLSLFYAGHPPLLIRRNGETTWRYVVLNPRSRPANLPLGAVNGVSYEQERIPLRSADRLFLYTDGLIEAPDATGKLFGKEQLLEVLDEVGSEDLRDLKKAVLAALRGHTGGSLIHDDVTLMAIEVR